jgi:chromosome segregation ATPase
MLLFVQVRKGAAEVNGTSSQVQEVAEETDRVVETATELALELQNRSSELMYQASVNNHRSSANEEAADQLLSEVASLQALAEAQHYESLQILQNATDTLSTAQELSNTTNQVTVQQLQELLSEYANEKSTVSDLRNRVRDLRAELQILTLTFTQAAQTLSGCYKTP